MEIVFEKKDDSSSYSCSNSLIDDTVADEDPGIDISPRKLSPTSKTEEILPGNMIRLRLPDDSKLKLKTSEEQILDRLDKLESATEEVLNDIRSSPRARLVSKLDANVQNTQMIISTLKQKTQSIIDSQDDDRLILKTILDGQLEDRKTLRSIRTTVEDTNTKIKVLWERLIELDTENMPMEESKAVSNK